MLWLHSFTGISYAHLLWALDRWQSVGHVLASVQQVQKLRRRPKTAPFVPEMSVVVYSRKQAGGVKQMSKAGNNSRTLRH
jgi:hypothetical protein